MTVRGQRWEGRSQRCRAVALWSLSIWLALDSVAQEELPFGGIGPSGMGHYHGKWGFDTFSILTPVFRQSRLNGMNLFMPPYRPIVTTMLRLMKRF